MQKHAFHLQEATIRDVHAAYEARTLTTRQLIELYLDRIEAYDRGGPEINAIINLNEEALAVAASLDQSFSEVGLTGPLHGIPVVMKDQIDVAGMATTLGSRQFEHYRPDHDSTVTAKLKQAGAVILGKSTLGEFGGGDTFGSLFGATRNPYDLERTVGGSSGGSAAAAAANFTMITIGQEGFASIRRPAAWNCVVGMRPTAGLVSRAGVFQGWPSRIGTLGPICRTVSDLAVVLSVIAGYDPEDPQTAHGFAHAPLRFNLAREALLGARLGVLRTPMGYKSEPSTPDFMHVDSIFDRAVGELAQAGAVLVDPVEIVDLPLLLNQRGSDPFAAPAFERWMARSANPPYHRYEDMLADRQLDEGMLARRAQMTGTAEEYQAAREQLMTNLLKAMADYQLDAIVHKTVEHTPTRISEGLNSPYVSSKGATHLNTFLVEVPSISVPAGFTEGLLPVGITFLGRPYSDQRMVELAYSYEQAFMHRVPPSSVPPLSAEP